MWGKSRRFCYDGALAILVPKSCAYCLVRGTSMFKKSLQLIVKILPMLALSACLDQYNPRPFWAQLDQEEKLGNAAILTLAEGGELPFEFGDEGEPVEEGEIDAAQLFASYCASCHGALGKADGPASTSLNPQPRNLSHVSWHNEVDDEHIAAVISGGGTRVGLSSAMPPWGGVLNEAQIEALVAHVRSLAN